MALKTTTKRPHTSSLCMIRMSNQYGDFRYLQLQWQRGKKKKTKSLGPVNEHEPTFLLDAVLRAIDVLNTEELIPLRAANKAARW